MKSPFITLNNVSYRTNDCDLIKGINLALDKSQFTMLTGANGCGKTTLSKLILGTITPIKGEIIVDSLNINKYKLHEIGSKIGYVFQNPSHQIFTPTINEELSFALKYKGIKKEIIQEKIDEMIDKFSLSDSLNTTTYNLSRGEKRRLAIACMMLNEPQYMILDEPTVGLDKLNKIKLFDELKQLNDNGIGILLISHDTDFAKEYAKRTLLMKDGKIHEVS